MVLKKRSVWKNLLLALCATPFVILFGIILVTVFREIVRGFIAVESAGYAWVMLIITFVSAFVYFTYKPKYLERRKREKIGDALVIYFQHELEKQNIPQLHGDGIKSIREWLLERAKVWAWNDEELWTAHYPNEAYSKHLFGIVDSLIKDQSVQKVLKNRSLRGE